MRSVIFVFLFLIISNVFALQDDYTFKNIEQKKNFEQLMLELRCLVCQNQNLAESNAALAVDLREQIYHKIQEGMSKQVIIDYLVERYGDFILYRPPVNAMTLGLWFGPIILLLSGLLYLLFYIRQKRAC